MDNQLDKLAAGEQEKLVLLRFADKIVARHSKRSSMRIVIYPRNKQPLILEHVEAIDDEPETIAFYAREDGRVEYQKDELMAFEWRNATE